MGDYPILSTFGVLVLVKYVVFDSELTVLGKLQYGCVVGVGGGKNSG